MCVYTALFEALIGIPPKMLCSGFYPGHADDGGIIGKVVKQAGALFEKQGQVIFNTRRCNAVANVLIQRALAVVYVEAGVPSVLKAANAGFVQRILAARKQVNDVKLFRAALGFRVKAAQGINFIVKQVNAVGLAATHGVQVQQRAANGVFTVLVNRVNVAVAALLQSMAHGLEIQRLPLF